MFRCGLGVEREGRWPGWPRRAQRRTSCRRTCRARWSRRATTRWGKIGEEGIVFGLYRNSIKHAVKSNLFSQVATRASKSTRPKKLPLWGRRSCSFNGFLLTHPLTLGFQGKEGKRKTEEKLHSHSRRRSTCRSSAQAHDF